MKFRFIFLLFLTYVFVGCEKSVDEPTPAQAVSGTFLAKTWNGVALGSMAYPINGETITVQIDPVSRDSVQVKIISTQNGFYSPGASAIYSKVYVKEINCTTCQYRRSYTLTLAPPTNAGTAENTISFDPNGNAYYTYIPPGLTNGAVQTVLVKRD
jgi:hypothetical protein